MVLQLFYFALLRTFAGFVILIEVVLISFQGGSPGWA